MSLIVSVPEVEMSVGLLVSVRLATSAESTAASLVPRMWMATEVSVPSALAVEKEADRGGLGDKGGRAVDVADRQRAGGRDVGRAVGLGQVGNVGREHRRVVGAGDVDGDRGQRAVGTGHREGVAIGGAGGKLVVRRARDRGRGV